MGERRGPRSGQRWHSTGAFLAKKLRTPPPSAVLEPHTRKYGHILQGPPRPPPWGRGIGGP